MCSQSSFSHRAMVFLLRIRVVHVAKGSLSLICVFFLFRKLLHVNLEFGAAYCFFHRSHSSKKLLHDPNIGDRFFERLLIVTWLAFAAAVLFFLVTLRCFTIAGSPSPFFIAILASFVVTGF